MTFCLLFSFVIKSWILSSTLFCRLICLLQNGRMACCFIVISCINFFENFFYCFCRCKLSHLESTYKVQTWWILLLLWLNKEREKNIMKYFQNDFLLHH